MRIIIDSGHGGKDPGASGFGMKEKDLNLIFANLLATELEKLNIDVDRSLINDNYYSAKELTDLIKSSGSSICISCHNNAFDGTARGFEVIHSIHTNGTLAKLIIEEVKKTSFKVRRAFSRESTLPSNAGEDYYYIIRLTYPDVETIIVEFGFMDNAADFKLLTDPAWQKKLTTAVATGISNYITSNSIGKTSILGDPVLTPDQLKSGLRAVNKSFDTGIVDLYYNISKIYGVKADLAFIQAIHETNWLRFTGVVKPEQNNFSGLGATGPNNPGLSFPTPEAGVEAHIQHLYAYATTTPLPKGRILYDTRFSLVRRGSAPNWEDLNGKWAVPGIGYGEKIIEMHKNINEKYPNETPSQPVTPENPVENQPTHWAKICHDELTAAGLLYSDHTSTLDEPASKGIVFCLVNRIRKELMKDE
ncbi:N-acetylmuramoyl-L-alanine amidase [Alkaliphilus peptidifermentans]|uniref:Mannosyl-glycoprotein endo-beta-N-acetylglucosaminidase n=1 Tax=Alkaliphilus peptidifermentans DSM 18978 TaxID=1120976 RepID=A0A1G5KMY7_9FIRM|nr:N-acetylmuramoyl-L-alanine amidase [Alkaliphilus peptidifermentans]SCZ01704.1 Mannosyl-glycoprotein endo-beta-N-acetylglucosaminidase [Alkaliphilus peptidifermentans DSM 18978]